MLIKNLLPLQITGCRGYAIIKNFTPPARVHELPKTWENFAPTDKKFGNDPFETLPDWTYVNPNRLTPLNEKQYAAKLQQVELAKTVVKYLDELKLADMAYEEKIANEKVKAEQESSRRPRAKGNRI